MTRKTRVHKQLKKIKREKERNDDYTTARIVDQEARIVQLGNGYAFDHNATEEDLVEFDPIEQFIQETGSSV